MQGTRAYYSTPLCVMASDDPLADPLVIRIGPVVYRFPDEEMMTRWAEAPDTPPEAWGAVAISCQVTAKPKSALRRWWEWVRSLRVRRPRHLMRPLILVAPLVMVWAFRHGLDGLGWVAFAVAVAAVIMGVE